MSLDDAGEKVRQLLIAHTESNQTIPYSELVSLISNVYRQAILTDLLEIIGEVKHDKGFMRAAPEYGPDYSVGRPKCEAIDGYECTCGADIANSTRDKIREKIKAYCE